MDTLGNCFETGFVVSVVSIKGYRHGATCIRREGRTDRSTLRRENVPVRRQNWAPRPARLVKRDRYRPGHAART